MGRRKIEIKAIKDDRNRSVTFLKRKGGLFKKAHELSVLCSVDVAVIIFGHNKKLYQFSSGDINETLRRYQYYGPPHEHKGPSDFKGKGGGDDDDEEEDEDDNNMNREDSLPPQNVMMPPHMQVHNAFPHIRPPGGPSASPPMANGMFPHRNSNTPQPPHIGSRPSSRNTVRRPSSNLVPLQHPHATPPPPPQNGFAYAPNPPIYNPQANAPPPQPSPQPQYQQFPQHPPPQPHQQVPPPPPPQQQQQQQQQPQPQPQQPPPPQQHHQQQVQPPPPPPPPPQTQAQSQAEARQPQFATEQQNRSPPTQSERFQPPPPTTRVSPPPPQKFQQPDATPPQIKQLSSRSRSIFTPIDDGGSILAQHFFGAPDPPRNIDGIKKENSPENKRLSRTAPLPTTSRPTPAQPRATSGLANEFRPPKRSDTSGSKSGARPKLNLHIPSEASDDEADGNSPGHRSAVNSANPARLTNGEHHNLILPPPSPSASAVLSAGASGPPNPFARPHPPTSQNNNAYNENRSNNLETPISALPSRYMDQELLASPGGLFGSSWANFGGSAILPSPNVSTPIGERGLLGGFGRGEKREAEEGLVGESKRLKT